MTVTARAAWLLERGGEWSGLGPSETLLGSCSPRVVSLISRMRDAQLFPDRWSEDEVLFAFLGALSEARAVRRRQYARVVAATAGEDVVRLETMRPRRAHGLW